MFRSSSRLALSLKFSIVKVESEPAGLEPGYSELLHRQVDPGRARAGSAKNSTVTQKSRIRLEPDCRPLNSEFQGPHAPQGRGTLALFPSPAVTVTDPKFIRVVDGPVVARGGPEFNSGRPSGPACAWRCGKFTCSGGGTADGDRHGPSPPWRRPEAPRLSSGLPVTSALPLVAEPRCPVSSSYRDLEPET